MASTMKHFLPVRFILCLTIVFRFLYAGNAEASHTMGADLTYTCIGGNTYRVTLSFYRDCIGIAAPANPFVTISSASCGQSMGVTCYPRPGTGQEVTPTCSSSVTTCNGGSFTGIQEWVYDGIVTLPMQCTDWRFGYSLCCRNAAITTINNPSTSTFYIYATLNNTISPCNTSPTFSNKPVPFICLGQQFCFNHGAYDSDGDSLAYQLITPLQTATTPVTYKSPYNASNPLNSSPATSFNTSTGDICLTPQALEVTVMAVIVREFRNGVLIGTVERDLQLTVMNCNNNLPSLTGINGTNNFSMTVCANSPACFNIFSLDPDTGQNLTVTWNNGIPGATFTTDSTARPTSNFCWTPTTSDIGRSFTFTATVRDDACPYRGSQTYSYTINVVGIQVNAGPDQAIACSDLATINAVASGGGPYTYSWSNGSTIHAITVGEGTYTVTASNGMCSATDTVNVTMPFIPDAAFTNSLTACANTPVSFTDQSTTPGGAIWFWYWNFGDGTSSLQQNPTHSFPGPGTYNVSLIIENTLGCRDTVTNQITIQSPPVAGFNWTGNCVNSTVTFNNLTTGLAGTWSWSFGNGMSSGQSDTSIVFTNPGTYNVTLIATGAPGCSDTIQQSITIDPLPVINAGADQGVCAGLPVTVNASGGQSYTWSNGQTIGSFTFTPSGSTTLVVSGTDANGCVNTDTVTIAVLPLPNVNAGPDVSVCQGGSLTLTAIGANTYIWTPGGSGASVVVQPGSSGTYTVVGTDANGCTDSDEVNVNVYSLPSVNAGPDQVVCEGASATLTASGSGTFSWYPSGSTGSNATVNPSSSTTYTVTITDGNGCTATDLVNVSVQSRPVINLTSFFLCAGSYATLNAGNPGSTYLWNTGDTTQIISINAGGIYSVTVTNSFGCSNTAAVNISYGTNLTINLGNVSFCQGDSAVLDAGYSGMTYLWTPGGQTSQTITVSNPGNYGVTVTDPSGCSGSINVTAMVNPRPSPNFTATAVCEGNAMSFTNGSTITSGSIASYQWNFGNGSTTTLSNPSFTYSSSGTYNVTLTATSAAGCTASVSAPVNVNPNPVAMFNVSNSCVGSPIQFTNQSSVSVGNIVSHTWDFGDGRTSTTVNPVITYASTGNYNVSLTVTTAGGCSSTYTRTVNVFPAPVADFSATTVCVGTATAFTNNSSISTGSVNNFQWNFNGSTSNQSNPSFTFPSAGTHQVTLIATSNHGCADTITQPVIVNALPSADAGPDQIVCRGSSVTLTASGGTNYQWTPGNITGASITVSPTSNTTYTVTVSNAGGCSASDEVSITVRNRPNTSAGPDHNICEGQSVTLNVNGGNNFTWNPGNVSGNSITVNPSVTTTYIVTGTGNNGCSNSDTVLVTVSPRPVVNAGPDLSICTGSTISITASGAQNYNWTPGGGNNASLMVSPSATTTYIVTGSTVAGCSASDTVTVNVNPVPVVNMMPTIVCSGSSTILDAANAGSTYSWSTGETSQTISVTDSGTYSVIVTNPFGCSALGNAVVTLGGTISTVPTNVAICQGQIATLTATGPTGSTFLWSTGPTNSSIQVTSGGNYYVTVTDTSGCAATLMYRVTVNPLPSPAFTGSPNCFGTPVNFTNGTSANGGIISSYAWDFGDNSGSTDQNPSHNFSSPGNYPVTLTVNTAAGCSASVMHEVIIHPRPDAAFSGPAVCIGTSTLFTQASTIASGSIASYRWYFGDNTSSTAAAPDHMYIMDGNYTVTLIATSAQGCSDTATGFITVNPLPEASFSLTDGCEGDAIQLVNSSVSNSGIRTYTWDLGNGTSSTQTDPVINYTVAGMYAIALTVIDSNGCENSAMNALTIHPRPEAAFATTSVCAQNSIQINDQSTISGGTISNYSWSLGNGMVSNSIQPSFFLANAGSYPVSLTITSDQGCQDTASGVAVAHPVPVAEFTADNACIGGPNQFSNLSTLASGSIASYVWDFGDQLTSVVATPTHFYNQSGSYNVTLTVVSDNGCTASVNHAVNVFPNPIAEFSSTNICHGSTTQILNRSTVPGGGQLSASWLFSDGTISSQFNPSHQFSSPGNYAATLIVTSSQGCTDSISGTLTVYRNPVARFAPVDGCMQTMVQFTDLSYSIDGNINVWLWNFGDGGTAVEGNPAHTYAGTGNFMVDLTTITIFGCQSSYADTVSIFDLPPVSMQSTNACVNAPVQFINTSGNASNINYTWDFGDGQQSTANTINHVYSTSGTYSVSLTAQSTFGCRNSAQSSVIVYPEPIAAFSTNDICQATSATFINNSTISNGSITAYAWDFGNMQSSTQVNPTVNYAVPGNYNVLLTVTSDQGCTSSTVQPLRVNPRPILDFNGTYQGCSPVTANFVNNSTILGGNIAGYVWDFGDGEVSTSNTPVHVYETTGLYSVTLTAVSDQGCYSTLTVPGLVRVHPSPIADFTADPIIVDNLSPVVHFQNQSSAYTSFMWSFGDGATSTDLHPVHAFADTGTYSALLITVNSFGCRDSVMKSIEVRPRSTLFVPNCFSPNGDGTNDVFKPEFTNMTDIQVWVFDRWGKLLKHWDSLDGNWDGYYEGRKCQTDTYVYKIVGNGIDGKHSEWVGHVSIIY